MDFSHVGTENERVIALNQTQVYSASQAHVQQTYLFYQVYWFLHREKTSILLKLRSLQQG